MMERRLFIILMSERGEEEEEGVTSGLFASS
jgi:hypothetical protein